MHCKLVIASLLAAGCLIAPALAQTASDKPAADVAAATGKGKAEKAAPAEKPAKELFGHTKTPANLSARAIGTYARGCLAGGAAVPVDGPAWQAMRLSRNRNWGHPNLVALVQRFAAETQKNDGWAGLLVGDLSQPRGGPMLTGHASHQIGLDADIWFTPMPDRRLSAREREDLSATSMLKDKFSVNPEIWSERHVRLIKRAATYPEVERVLVHPAIKKALCEGASKVGTDRAWLNKVRPVWGHHYHFHIRIACPKGSPTCKPQAPTPTSDTCGKELDDWMALLARPPRPPPAKPPKPRPPITMAQLPNECRAVLDAPASVAKPSSAKQ